MQILSVLKEANKVKKMDRDKESKKKRPIRSACVVVPTFNEANNIKLVLDRIAQNRDEEELKDIKLMTLVVDDSSPDGTADIVRECMKNDKDIHLLSRAEKEGLGAAYIAGMKYSMETLDPDVILEMDADLSHDPADIPRLLRAIKDGADFAIGSRYVKGGSIPKNWGFHRVLISKSANLYTRMILGIKKIQDCTGGFRAIHTSVFDKVDLDLLNVKGYAFQISLLHATNRFGFKITEIPIHFAERNAGKSKIQMSDMIELGLSVLRLRIGTPKVHTHIRRQYAAPMRLEK